MSVLLVAESASAVDSGMYASTPLTKLVKWTAPWMLGGEGWGGEEKSAALQGLQDSVRSFFAQWWGGERVRGIPRF